MFYHPSIYKCLCKGAILFFERWRHAVNQHSAENKNAGFGELCLSPAVICSLERATLPYQRLEEFSLSTMNGTLERGEIISIAAVFL